MRLPSPSRSPLNWSCKRKVALILFALIMAYLQSFDILGFYTSDTEYWGTVWIGVTAEQRLLSFALGLLANLGLMAMPFLRQPGRMLRTLVALSLGFGLLISTAWLRHGLDTLPIPGSESNASIKQIEFLLLIFFLSFYLSSLECSMLPRLWLVLGS
jgi:hypothetical protein